jgi:hypothetical protein
MDELQISAGAAVAAISGLTAALGVMWVTLLGKIKSAEQSCAEDRRLLHSMLLRIKQLDRRHFTDEVPPD